MATKPPTRYVLLILDTGGREMEVSVSSWGYPQSFISNDGIFPNKNHPASLGYPHDYRNPQMFASNFATISAIKVWTELPDDLSSGPTRNDEGFSQTCSLRMIHLHVKSCKLLVCYLSTYLPIYLSSFITSISGFYLPIFLSIYLPIYRSI